MIYIFCCLFVIMKSHRHIVATLLLILFSCMQLVDLHAVGHDASDTDCKICVIAAQNLDSNCTSIAITSIPEAILVPADTIISVYVSPCIERPSSYFFLNKAPPIV